MRRNVLALNVNLDRNLIDCENFYIIESSTKDTGSNDEPLELNRMEITKDHFEQAATEFSKSLRQKQELHFHGLGMERDSSIFYCRKTCWFSCRLMVQ